MKMSQTRMCLGFARDLSCTLCILIKGGLTCIPPILPNNTPARLLYRVGFEAFGASDADVV
jgi:hypothetical protein